jgi:hypothetical protein
MYKEVQEYTCGDKNATSRSALHQTELHRPEHQRQAVRLHQATSKIFVEFYIININITKIYIHMVFCRCRDLRSPLPPKTKTRRKTTAAAAQDKNPTTKIAQFFLRLWLHGYNDHDNLDHGYIMTGYLDFDIKNNVYNNLRTPINSIHIVTCVHATPAVTAGGKREEELEGDVLNRSTCNG